MDDHSLNAGRCFAIGVIVAVALGLSACQTSDVFVSNGAELELGSLDKSHEDTVAGKAHFVEANYGLAERHFRKAVELRADNAEAWLGLAASYDHLGRFDFADRAYDQAIKIAGRHPRILNNRGYSYLLRGDRAKARPLLMEAQAAMPEDPVVKRNLALLAGT